ncbi:hypothetical protein J6590_057232 [Homalodisca vitripennis]|nr:hypothetical protein J6590_057232 [Homalodisca vitripennis]
MALALLHEYFIKKRLILASLLASENTRVFGTGHLSQERVVECETESQLGGVMSLAHDRNKFSRDVEGKFFPKVRHFKQGVTDLSLARLASH